MTAPAPLPVPLGPASGRRVVPVLTPEGVLLPFEVATAGERLAAYLTDLAIQWGLLIALWILLVLALDADGKWVAAAGLIVTFLVMNGWFLFFELGPRAATPGKRWFGLRVMDAGGGVLTPGAVAARNLMRNLELHVPLVLLVSPDALGTDSGWVRLLLVLWALLLAGLPLFNRLRLRPGDLVGGTLVVAAPRPLLLAELTSAAPRPAETLFAFTPAQLSVYGVYELQVLEDLLRRDGRGPDPDPLPAVAQRIAKKIRWSADLSARESPAFLRAFYAALRRHLEERLLLGKRKEDKRSSER